MKAFQLLVALACALFMPSLACGQKLARPEAFTFFQEKTASMSPELRLQFASPDLYWEHKSLEKKLTPRRPAMFERRPGFEFLSSLEESRVVAFIDRTIELRHLSRFQDEFRSKRKFGTEQEFFVAGREAIIDVVRKPVLGLKRLWGNLQ